MLQGLPHDIYTVLPFQRPLWLDVILGGICVLLLGFLVYFVFVWYRKRAEKPKKQVIKTSWDLLFDELDIWESRLEFRNPKEGRELFYGLSLVLRSGIELALAIPATDLTLREIKSRFRSSYQLDTVTAKAIVDFLDRADMIKFADATTSQTEARECAKLVRKWLIEIKPKPVQSPSSEMFRSGNSKGLT